jgi:hypothetical protein
MIMQKTDIPGIYKDGKGVLINKDKDALAAYKLRKEKDRKLLTLEENLNNLKSDIQEIKDLLKGLVK